MDLKKLQQLANCSTNAY